MDFVDEICLFKCGSDGANIVKNVVFVLRDFSSMLVNFVLDVGNFGGGGMGCFFWKLADDFVGLLGGVFLPFFSLVFLPFLCFRNKSYFCKFIIRYY